MKFEIKEVIITPEYASELLKFNTNNRAVRQNKVSQLAESMNKGEWELSNDAIVISEGNVLLNGQHRLLAVVKSGVSCPFILFTGAQDSAFDVMDTPALRRVSDVITRKGGKSAQKAETTIAKYLNIHYDLINHWESIKRFSREVVATRKEMVAFYDKKSALINRWIRIRKLTPRECFRLMDVDESNIDKIQGAGISDSQQYKMAGNSIVVACMEGIFRNLFYDEGEEEFGQLTLF